MHRSRPRHRYLTSRASRTRTLSFNVLLQPCPQTEQLSKPADGKTTPSLWNIELDGATMTCNTTLPQSSNAISLRFSSGPRLTSHVHDQVLPLKQQHVLLPLRRSRKHLPCHAMRPFAHLVSLHRPRCSLALRLLRSEFVSFRLGRLYASEQTGEE